MIEATYSVKGQGQQKKEHVGYKVQVAETVSEATLAPGEPTRNFILGIVTHPAYQSDEAGAVKMEQEQAQMGLEKPPVQYVDGAYVSARSWRKPKPKAGRSLVRPNPRPRKRADSAWKIFKSTSRSAPPFVRRAKPTPSAAAWRRKPAAR